LTLNHTETYSYDPNFDYLTGANYGDGLPNATPTWSYDAAGNRTDSVCDNLNRATSIGGQATTCDILGNRLSLGSNIAYGWDCLNRMTSYTSAGVSNSYWYRADGMRVGKLVGSTGTTTTYAYDGQMGFEDQDTTGAGTKVTDYGLGARGIDYIASTGSGSTTVGFPLYDSHGNMTACVFRGANGAYSLGNQRSYDAWGNVREGAASGDPKGRYCANLGHKQDDESGLVYMRARYYDPGSGRFLTEDPDKHGYCWFAYARGNPNSWVDRSGRDDEGLESEEAGESGEAALDTGYVEYSTSALKSQFADVLGIKPWQAGSMIEEMKKIEKVLGPADNLLYNATTGNIAYMTGIGPEVICNVEELLDLFGGCW
jgi:RHS repeat-associated protein